MSRQLSKPDLELWTGLTRTHIKALRAGLDVRARYPNKDGHNYILVMGIKPDPDRYAPLESTGWEVLIVSNPREVWQQFKRRDRRMTVQFNTDAGLVIHVHIWSWDNLKKAMERKQHLETKVRDD